MKARTHVKSEITQQGSDMRVVMKHLMPGQKNLSWILQPVKREVSMKLPYLERFIGWGCVDGWQGYQLGSFCSIMDGKWWKVGEGSARDNKEHSKRKIVQVWRKTRMTRYGDWRREADWGKWEATFLAFSLGLEMSSLHLLPLESHILGDIHELYICEVSVLLS